MEPTCKASSVHKIGWHRDTANMEPNGGSQTRKCIETKVELTKQVSCKTPTKSEALSNDDLTLSLLTLAAERTTKITARIHYKSKSHGGRKINNFLGLRMIKAKFNRYK